MMEILPAMMEFSRSADISRSLGGERNRVELNQLTARSAAGVSNFDFFGEAECIRRESRQFNCDAGSAVEQSTEAEKEMYFCLADKLRKEIEEANVERVFIDLARAEAEREYTEIKAKREADAARFGRKIEIASSKIRSLSEELIAAEELEAELVATYQDLNALQDEMEFIEVMEKSSVSKYLRDKLELASSQAELEVAKKELPSLQEESFKLMAEMDNIRAESIKIAEEREQLAKSERKREADLRSLNSNLHTTMSILELAASAEKRAGAIVANLSEALQQLQSDVAVAKREAELTNQEVSAIKEETATMYLATKIYEERLRDAAKELAASKELEAVALEQLQTLTESTMRERAIAALFCSTITLPRFEYYYLTKQARSAKEVADKKVAAAEAWIEAIQAREKEMCSLRAETTHRRDDLMRRKNKKTEKKMTSSREHDRERELAEPLKPKLTIAMPRRSITLGYGGSSTMQPRRSFHLGSGVAVAAGESRTVRKVRRSSSLLPTRRRSITRPHPAFSSTRKKAVHGLVKFLSRSVRKNLEGQCIRGA